MRRARKTVRTTSKVSVLERGKAIQAISRNHAYKDTSADLEARFHGKGAGSDGYVMVCVGFRTKRSYIFSAALEAEHGGDGDAGGDEMISTKKVLEAAQIIADYCKEQYSCQNCIFRLFGAEHWKCHIEAFNLQDVLSNISAKNKNHGWI